MKRKEFLALKMDEYFPEDLQDGEYHIKRLELYDDDKVAIQKKLRRMGYSSAEFVCRDAETFISLSHKKVKRSGDKNTCIMSDANMEKRTNWPFVREARGDILVAGLGLGIILLAVQDKKEVKSITVVEPSEEIMRMVMPRVPLNNKVTVETGNIFLYKPDRKYDVIYFDIWNNFSIPNLVEMIELEETFSDYLNPGGWIDCWGKKECLDKFRKKNMELGNELVEAWKIFDKKIKERVNGTTKSSCR